MSGDIDTSGAANTCPRRHVRHIGARRHVHTRRLCRCGRQLRGKYDGESISSNYSEAVKITVEGQDIDSITIRLPALPEDIPKRQVLNLRGPSRRRRPVLGIERGGQSAPPAGRFASVSVGQHYSCGVGVDGTLACWGSFKLRQDRTAVGNVQICFCWLVPRVRGQDRQHPCVLGPQHGTAKQRRRPGSSHRYPPDRITRAG